MAKREKISSVDTAWLRMDKPSNLMMICGVLIFKERMDVEKLATVIRERFLRFRRFQQKAVQLPGVAYWETDSDFDLSSHLHHLALPGQASKSELQKLVSDLMSSPLDSTKPMWQFHLVDNYEGGSALIIRIHHCYADGIALIQVMLSMADQSRAQSGAHIEIKEQKESDPLQQLIRPVADAAKSAMKFGQTLVEKGMALWHDPAKAVEFAEHGASFTNELAKLALMGQDSPTRFKGKPGVIKRVAWAPPLPLDEVKSIGKALGCSVNDVLLSCVAGALRAYLLSHGDSVTGLEIRAVVPVNLRPLEEAHRLGNQFGLVFLALPIGIEDPLERLHAVRANMQALKGSYQPLLVLGLLAAVGMAPKLLQDQLLSILSKNASAVMTNVPGPQQPLYLAGCEIDSIMFWVPQSGDIGMGVSILSYNGGVYFGLATDKKLCPDPEDVINRFASEFEKLVLTTLMMPWQA